MNSKVVLITGGVSGLGLGIAESLLKRQAQVIVFDVNADSFAQLSDKFDCYEVDVTDETAVINAVGQVIAKYIRIDVLINNAGVIHSQPLINIMSENGMRHSYPAFKKVIKTDLDSVFLMSSIVAEQMIMKRTQGAIINISSICAKGKAGQTAYAAAKAGVEAMTKVWAKELAGLGVRTNAIAPGFIDTPSTVNALNGQLIRGIVDATPMKRLGSIENIARAVSYVIDNDFVNGSILEVDGGLVV